MAFFEVKWSDLGIKEARRILTELEEKSKFVDWNKREWQEHFELIAKKLEGKEKLKEEGYLAMTLRIKTTVLPKQWSSEDLTPP